MIEIKAIDKDTIQVTSETAILDVQGPGSYNLSLPETDNRVVIGWVTPMDDHGVYHIDCSDEAWDAGMEVYLSTCEESFLESEDADIVSDRKASFCTDGERDAYEIADKMNATLKYALENVL